MYLGEASYTVLVGKDVMDGKFTKAKDANMGYF